MGGNSFNCQHARDKRGARKTQDNMRESTVHGQIKSPLGVRVPDEQADVKLCYTHSLHFLLALHGCMTTEILAEQHNGCRRTLQSARLREVGCGVLIRTESLALDPDRNANTPPSAAV